ncbi:uncharacterized protein TA08275 [Theileria annulata]|uniref:Uncharacterized protein n=1 Tax=Theileria annulata TaxID=5874 RepID=Q4UAJ7_THEAN|nr:uncharacterized protein TA08275 [Theileria annulata]CAI76154.1 hypothetical protein TA08275 [Theileria annulata]|eukprot:XP_952780.1 hypothetical protein TA08275 [Theileria annulata]
MKLNTKTFLIYFITNYKYNEQNLILLSNNQDSIGNTYTISIKNFINEEDYKYLPPEQQLIKLNEDKKLYNNVQRLIKRSREYELPKNEITFESIYPNTQLTNGTGTNTGTGVTNDGTNTNDGTELDNEIDIKEIYNKEYEPIRTEYNSKNTLELIPSIVQKPIIPTEDRIYLNT